MSNADVIAAIRGAMFMRRNEWDLVPILAKAAEYLQKRFPGEYSDLEDYQKQVTRIVIRILFEQIVQE